MVNVAFPLARSSKALSAPDEPIRRDNDNNDRVDCTNIIHRARCDRLDIRERVHDDSEECPSKKYIVGEQAEGTKPEWAVF